MKYILYTQSYSLFNVRFVGSWVEFVPALDTFSQSYFKINKYDEYLIILSNANIHISHSLIYCFFFLSPTANIHLFPLCCKSAVQITYRMKHLSNMPCLYYCFFFCSLFQSNPNSQRSSTSINPYPHNTQNIHTAQQPNEHFELHSFCSHPLIYAHTQREDI